MEIDISLTISFISIGISLVSLTVSLIVLYLNFWKKKTPYVHLPHSFHLIYSKPDEDFFIFIPLVFINKGAKMLIINSIEFDLLGKNYYAKFHWFTQSNVLKLPSTPNMVKYLPDTLIVPFELKKYSSATKMISFITSDFQEFTDSGFYYINFKISYDNNEIESFQWKILIEPKDIKNLKDKEMMLVRNLFESKYICLLDKSDTKFKNLLKNL